MTTNEATVQAAIQTARTHITSLTAWAPTADVDGVAECRDVIEAVLAEIRAVAMEIVFQRLAAACPDQAGQLDAWAREIIVLVDALNALLDRLQRRADELAFAMALATLGIAA